MNRAAMLARLRGLRSSGASQAKAWGGWGMERANPMFMKAGSWGGTKGMADADILRRGQFRVGVGAGVVGASTAVSGIRAKSSGGYTGGGVY